MKIGVAMILNFYFFLFFFVNLEHLLLSFSKL